MDYFAGLDVSVKDTSVCIVDEAGKITRAHRCTQLPRLRLLRMRNRERALEICSRLRRTQRGNLSAISPVTRWISASYQRSPVVSTAAIASPMQFLLGEGYPGQPRHIVLIPLRSIVMSEGAVALPPVRRGKHYYKDLQSTVVRSR